MYIGNMAEAKRFFTERDIEELLRPNDKSNADFISNLAVSSLLRGREEPQDKAAVGKLYRKEPLYWENPRNETRLPKDVPFESQLQKEAIRRQKEAEPQSGHVEPQFFPAAGVVKGIGQTGRLVKEDLKNLFNKMLKK